MLPPLMARNGIDMGMMASSTMAPWKQLLSHPLFAGSGDRLPDSSYLHKVCDVYCQRNGALWSREDVQRWVLTAANEAIGELSVLSSEYSVKDVTSRQCTLYSLLSHSDLNTAKYEHVEVADFAEEFTHLPADAAAIDPMLDDPHVLSGGVKFQNFMDSKGKFLPPFSDMVDQRQQQQQLLRTMQGLGSSDEDEDLSLQARLRQWWEVIGGVDGDVDVDGAHNHNQRAGNNEDIVAAAVAVAGVIPAGDLDIGENDEHDGLLAGQHLNRMGNADGAAVGLIGRRRRGQQAAATAGRTRRTSTGPEPNIDLRLPLMQLFLTTIFPWIHVPQLQRR